MFKGEQKIRKINILTLVVLLLLAATPVKSSFSVVKVSSEFDALVDNESPSIAVDDGGRSYIAWSGTSGDDQGIFWARMTEDGTIEKTIEVVGYEDSQIYDDYDPQIAVDSEGNSCVTWYGVTRDGSSIFWAKIDSSGILENVQKISATDRGRTSDRNPQIVVDAEGNSYVTWQGAGGSDQDIYFLRIDDTGVRGAAEQISTHKDNVNRNDYSPQIAVDQEGNSYVVWYGHDGNDLEIYWVPIDRTGTRGSVEKISTHVDNRDLDDYNPQIAVDSEGNSYVVWYGSDGNDQEIYWVGITAAQPGTVEKISTHLDNLFKNDYNPQIAVDAQGNSYITWYGFDGIDDEIYWTTIAPSGNQEATLKISTSPYNRIWDDYNPQIAVDSGGNSYVVWYGFNGTDDEIFWAKIAASGIPATPQVISLHTDNEYHNDFDPQIAVNNGNSYVTWYGFDGSDNHIYFSLPETVAVPSESSGPLTSQLSVEPDQIPQIVLLKAVISDVERGGSAIRGAEYFMDVKGASGAGIPMAAADGAFDSAVEGVRAFIDVTNLALGIHLIYVHGQDAAGNWGPFDTVYFRMQRLSFSIE
ncbi:MAG: hypothetical protein HXS43_05990 [Theionarchaea archaeon]|nr:hypothetical protein [Theionarchaea archaeon]